MSTRADLELCWGESRWIIHAGTAFQAGALSRQEASGPAGCGTLKRKPGFSSQEQLLRHKSSPRDKLPQNKMSPATREFLERMNASEEYIWTATPAQAGSTQVPLPASKANESSSLPSMTSAMGASADRKSSMAWFEPSAGHQQEGLQMREVANAAESSSKEPGKLFVWPLFS